MKILFFSINKAGLAVILMAAVFVFTVFWGMSSGRSVAQAKLVLEQAKAIEQAMDFFYQDNNRFPDLREFSDSNILLRYMSALPNDQSQNEVCSENFVYKRMSLKAYELNFCLASSSGGFKQGWNKSVVSK